MPYNEYHLFLLLEEQMRLLAKIGKYPKDRHSETEYCKPNLYHKSNDLPHGYEGIVLPNFPPRYENLSLPEEWFVRGSRRNLRTQLKRRDPNLLKRTSRNAWRDWKRLDNESKNFLCEVASILRERYNDIVVMPQSLKTKNVPPRKRFQKRQQEKATDEMRSSISVVDMSDDEILSIWDSVEPEENDITEEERSLLSKTVDKTSE